VAGRDHRMDSHEHRKGVPGTRKRIPLAEFAGSSGVVLRLETCDRPECAAAMGDAFFAAWWRGLEEPERETDPVTAWATVIPALWGAAQAGGSVRGRTRVRCRTPPR